MGKWLDTMEAYFGTEETQIKMKDPVLEGEVPLEKKREQLFQKKNIKIDKI